MKLVSLLLVIPVLTFSQINIDYNPSTDNPFGKLNPEAPKKLSPLC